MSRPANHTLLVDIQRLVGQLAEQVGGLETETKAIAHKIWRGNGGRSLSEIQTRQGLMLEQVLERVESVEKRLDELSKPAEKPKKPESEKKAPAPKRGVERAAVIAWALFALALAALALVLGSENTKLLLDLLR